MHKFMMLFYQPKNIHKFEDSYNNLLALIERMPHIQRRQVINVVGSPYGASTIYRILEVYFEDREIMQQSLLSEAGQEAGGQIQTMPKDSFEMIFAEVFEEDGGATSTTPPPNDEQQPDISEQNTGETD